MKILIDTCVIIDLLQKREPFFESAHKIFLSAANERFEAAITAKSAADIYYLTHRVLHDKEKTRSVIGSLFKLFTVLDTTAFDCKNALLSETPDYEDALMIETAVRSGYDGIVTRNLKDYAKASVRVFAPEEFLSELENAERGDE